MQALAPWEPWKLEPGRSAVAGIREMGHPSLTGTVIATDPAWRSAP